MMFRDRIPPPPSLQLFQPDEVSASYTGELSALMRLTEFYDRYVLPQILIHASTETVKLHRTALRYWCEFTNDPPLRDITRETCSRFVSLLARVIYRGEPITSDTQHKHCRHIQLVLDRAGPEIRGGKYNRFNAGLLQTVPALLKPDLLGGDVEDVYTLEEIKLWLEACHLATAPRSKHFRTADFWTSLGLVAYNIGLRIGTLLLLRFEWFRRDDLGWWMNVPAKALKQKRPQEVYFNRFAMAAVDHIRTDRERIFEWNHQQHWLHTIRCRMLAGSALPANRRLGFRAFRKAFNTECATINPLAAKMALGHRVKDVQKDHYTHRKLMSTAMDKLPQPDWQPDREGKQLRLF